jgi:hypothetical protein
MRSLVCGLVVILLIIVSCVTGQWGGYSARPLIEEDQARYRNFDHPWEGRQVEQLIGSRGLPDNILDAQPLCTSFRQQGHVLLYVYNRKPGRDRSCIDTFAVAEDTGTIVKYYCR